MIKSINCIYGIFLVTSFSMLCACNSNGSKSATDADETFVPVIIDSVSGEESTVTSEPAPEPTTKKEKKSNKKSRKDKPKEGFIVSEQSGDLIYIDKNGEPHQATIDEDGNTIIF